MRNQITFRQAEVLSLLIAGYNYKDIAGKLFIETKTVRSHMYAAMARLGANTPIHAVVLYLQISKT